MNEIPSPLINRTALYYWRYRDVSLFANDYPRREQVQFVDHLDRLHQEAKSRIAYIDHFDDDNGVCQSLEIVCIEPEPSNAEKWLWLAGWRGNVSVSFGLVPDFRS